MENDKTTDAVVHPLTYELEKYKNNIYNKTFESAIKSEKELLSNLRKVLQQFEGDIIYTDLKVEKNNYVDETECWVEEQHTLEIHLLRVTPEFISTVENFFGHDWEIKTTINNSMVMYFKLNNSVVYIQE